ncbi:MAG: hypothetical protein KC777_12080 [Cyanobacteria bacterium HKST-UBA02]|nr:hypothetical protein [Cyanobacteria bacterium HKST-UBA02]
MTNAAPQSDQDTAKKTTTPGGDSTSAAGNQGDAKVEKDKASTAGLSEVQQAQGHPGTNNDGNAAAAATADAGEHHDGADGDDHSGESTAQAEVRQTLENGGVVANTASPEVQAKLVADGTIPAIAVTSEVRDDGPEAGADQPGMVEKGSKSIFGSLKDGFTSMVSTVSDAGSAALDEAIDLWNHPLDTMGDWYDGFMKSENQFLQNLMAEQDLSKAISDSTERAATHLSDVLKDGQVVSQEDSDKLVSDRLPEGTSLDSVNSFLKEPWKNPDSKFTYDESNGAFIDTDEKSGMTRVENVDGSVQLTLKDGTVISRDKDGNEVWKFKDGAISKPADGGEIKASFGGAEMARLHAAETLTRISDALRQETFSEDQNPWKEVSDSDAEAAIKSRLTGDVDLAQVNKALDTPFYGKNMDTTYDSDKDVWIDVDKDTGVKRFESGDGKVAVELPDGTTVVRDQDGKTVWNFSDKTVLKTSDGKYSIADGANVATPAESGSAVDAEKQRFDEATSSLLQHGSDLPADQVDNALKGRIENYDLAKEFVDNPFIDGVRTTYDSKTGSFIDVHQESGMVRVEDSNGNITLRDKNGTIISQVDKDGNKTWIANDGVLKQNKDGTARAAFGDVEAEVLSKVNRGEKFEITGEQAARISQRENIDTVQKEVFISGDVSPEQVRTALDAKKPFGRQVSDVPAPNGNRAVTEVDDATGISRTVTKDADGKVISVTVDLPNDKNNPSDNTRVKQVGDGPIEWSRTVAGDDGKNRTYVMTEHTNGQATIKIRNSDGTETNLDMDQGRLISANNATPEAAADEVSRLGLKPDTLSGQTNDGEAHQTAEIDGKKYMVITGRYGGVVAIELGEDGRPLFGHQGDNYRYNPETGLFQNHDGKTVDLSSQVKVENGTQGLVVRGPLAVTTIGPDNVVTTDTTLPDGTKYKTVTQNGETKQVKLDSEGNPTGQEVTVTSQGITGVDPDGHDFTINDSGVQTVYSRTDSSGNYTDFDSGFTYGSNGNITDYQGHSVYDYSSSSWGGDDSTYLHGGMTEAQAEATVESQVNGARTVAMPAFLEALSLGKTGGNVAGMLGRIEGGLGQISAAKALCIQLGAFDQLATLDSMMATGCAAQAQAVRVAGMEANAGIFMKGAVGNSFEMNQLRAKIANGTFISIQGEITEWNKQHENV